MAEKNAKQDQDGALAWLVVTTLAPHWRSLLVAVVMLLATAALNVAPPYLVQQAIDGPIAQRDTAGLWPLAGLYGGVALLMFALQYGQTYFLQIAGQRALADVRARLFSNMLNQGQEFFGRIPVGDLVTRLTGDIDALNALLSSSAVLILSDTRHADRDRGDDVGAELAAGAAGAGGAADFGLGHALLSAAHSGSSTSERTALARTSSFLSEQLNGMLLVQLFGRQRESAQEFDHLNATYRETLIVLRRHSALFWRCRRCWRRWVWPRCCMVAAGACWPAGPRWACWWHLCSTLIGLSSRCCGFPSNTMRCRSRWARPSAWSGCCRPSQAFASRKRRPRCHACAARSSCARSPFPTCPKSRCCAASR